MSYSQEYFPPKATKYKWHPKALNYSPWVCNFWDHWPASINCWVDRSEDGTFRWSVEVRNFYKGQEVLSGVEPDALQACLCAERVAEQQKNLIWKPWMDDAIAAGWRPPA